MRGPLKFLSLLALSVLCPILLSAQGKGADSDSLVRLLSATSAETIEKGTEIRKVIGPAVFLHNDTYLKCDTAFWYVNRDYIDAVGRVSIEQENTILTSDKMHYIINRDLAQFRGDLVELKDKEGNNRISTEILVDNAYFGDSKKSDAGSETPAPAENTYFPGYGAYQAPAPGGTGEFAPDF